MFHPCICMSLTVIYFPSLNPVYAPPAARTSYISFKMGFYTPPVKYMITVANITIINYVI
jgi:hypothetical protein